MTSNKNRNKIIYFYDWNLLCYLFKENFLQNSQTFRIFYSPSNNGKGKNHKITELFFIFSTNNFYCIIVKPLTFQREKKIMKRTLLNWFLL